MNSSRSRQRESVSNTPAKRLKVGGLRNEVEAKVERIDLTEGCAFYLCWVISLYGSGGNGVGICRRMMLSLEPLCLRQSRLLRLHCGRTPTM